MNAEKKTGHTKIDCYAHGSIRRTISLGWTESRPCLSRINKAHPLAHELVVFIDIPLTE